ncbi:hypothetical protein CPA56_00005, partial [Bombella sp. TMW2.1889]|nr:hypothetical protein [Bombella mellum]
MTIGKDSSVTKSVSNEKGTLNLSGTIKGTLDNAATANITGGQVLGTTTSTGTLNASSSNLANIINKVSDNSPQTVSTATLLRSSAGAVTNEAGATFSATNSTIDTATNSGDMT